MGIAVAATMLAGPLFLAAVPATTAAPETPAELSLTAETQAFDASVFAAREEAQASRGQDRAAVPPVAPVAPAPVAPPAPPAPAPEPVPAPAPAPPPPPPPVVAQLWVTTAVNVRTGPAAGTERVGYLEALDQVGTTGTTQDGWAQVVLGETVGWVNGKYLSETEPAPEPVEQPEAAPAGAAPADEPGTSDAPCSKNPEIERSLKGNAIAVYRAVCAAHGGSVSSFGGFRPGDGGDHGTGRAVDVMVSGEAGWEISRFLQARAGELGITYLIYEQQIWMAGSPAGAWEYMEDRGGATANHFDHVHVSVG